MSKIFPKTPKAKASADEYRREGDAKTFPRTSQSDLAWIAHGMLRRLDERAARLHVGRRLHQYCGN